MSIDDFDTDALRRIDAHSHFAACVDAEIRKAESNFKPFNSAHEGFAVLLEEVDELKAEVWKNQSARNWDAMYRECVQVAAMATRMAVDVIANSNRGHEKRDA